MKILVYGAGGRPVQAANGRIASRRKEIQEALGKAGFPTAIREALRTLRTLGIPIAGPRSPAFPESER